MNKLTNNPTEQVSPQPSLGKDSSAKRDSNAQAVEPKGGDGCTDLQAALRKACEDANENIIAALNGTTSIKHMGPAVFECIARCYERRLTPVFETLRDSVIEECASLKFDERPIGDPNPYYEDAWACGWYTAIRNMRAAIRALKGAPR